MNITNDGILMIAVQYKWYSFTGYQLLGGQQWVIIQHPAYIKRLQEHTA